MSRTTSPIPPVTITIEPTADQRRRWAAYAEIEGLTLEAWIAAAADRAARDADIDGQLGPSN